VKTLGASVFAVIAFLAAAAHAITAFARWVVDLGVALRCIGLALGRVGIAVGRVSIALSRVSIALSGTSVACRRPFDVLGMPNTTIWPSTTVIN
jgi:hypothetical protein